MRSRVGNENFTTGHHHVAFNGALGLSHRTSTWTNRQGGALRRSKVDSQQASEVIMGQILFAGEGQNPARHLSATSCFLIWRR
jgi:acetyl-CoA acetyltransferase